MSRWLKILLVALVATGTLVVSLPWWLGGVLRPVLRAQGVTFNDYARVGYAQFRLQQVTYTGTGFAVGADQVQTSTPALWLWQRLRGTAPAVTIENWRLVRTPRPAAVAPAPAKIQSLPDLQAAVARIGPTLFRWLPRAHLTGGVVQGFGPELRLARVDWQNAVLTVDGLDLAGRQFSFVLTPAADGSLTLTAQTPENDARLRLVLAGPEINGEAVLWDQPLQLAARFGAVGWLPVEASAVAENWRLPAARVKLGVPYAQVLGEARLLWRDGAFELSLAARAEPAPETKNAPPFNARAAAHGTLRELTVTALEVDAPFATAKLTAPVTLSLDRPLAAESARLTVQADLAKLPWLEARGQVEGEVTVAGGTAVARQDFALQFRDVALGAFAVKTAQARGTLAWPRLALAELTVQLDDTSSLQARGDVNWQTRELAGVAVDAKLNAAWFARWLPAGVTWTTAEFSATAEGPLAGPRHAGTLKLDGVHLPPLRPLALEASWQGTGGQADLNLLSTAGDSTLTLAGALSPAGLHLTTLRFMPDGGPGLDLAAPAHLAWSPVWQVEDLKLAGPSGALTGQGRGGPAGDFTLTATHFPSTWLQDWVTFAGPNWQVDRWQATGRIENNALVFETTLAAQIAVSPEPARVSLMARGDQDGVELTELKVMSGERTLTQATGRLPLAWLMTPTPHLVIDEAAPLTLAATTEPDSPLWATLASATGLQLTDAAAKIDLQGTLRQPAGNLQLAVARLSLASERPGFSLPECTDLTLTAEFNRDQATLTTFSAKLAGQQVRASGQTPMDDAGWQQLWRAPQEFDWRKAEARIEIPDADLAPLARHLPVLIVSRGRLSAHLALARGGNFSGALQLTDASSRPLAPFGSFQDIQAALTFENRSVTVSALTATLGGEPVAVTGAITLVPGQAPRLALGLKGNNLPLVRNTGLLLRTDLDLHADTDAAGLTRLSGTVAVRDCLVLANLNLRTLLPTGRRGVTRQPPYFSVATAPYNDWPLAVTLRAPGTIRVRTTVYNGTASASFHLGGTLGEPRAVGELTVDQGQVLFPFATFRVQQGAIRLREADPFHAVVSLDAASQRRDYQLRLAMTGELPAPNVVLSSTPAMESAEVLLMVMTGQPPVGNATATTTGASGPRLAMLGAYLGRGVFQDLGFGGEDRLEISAGERVSRDGRETYEFEYKLGGRWSLQGEYDQFDSYNAGLKWRAYTEESKPDEAK